MRKVLIRFLLLATAFVLIFSAVKASRVDVAAATVSAEAESVEPVYGGRNDDIGYCYDYSCNVIFDPG